MQQIDWRNPKPSYELQLLDCNCSDCKFLYRDLVKRQRSVDLHYKWQKDHFDGIRVRKLRRAKFWQKKGESDKAKLLIKEARKMVFQFDESECALHYGYCNIFDKEVSFIPNACQLETQDCFKHRKDA